MTHSKKARERRRAWLRTPEGRAYAERLRSRTPEDAAELRRLLKPK